MRHLTRRFAFVLLLGTVLSAAAAPADAQTGTGSPWSVDFGIGWDNDIAGNINSSAIGTLNNQAVVILKNTYEEVYGTGLHLRGGVGYRLPNSSTELRLALTFQSSDADYVVPMGDIGLSKLYAQYSDYQAFLVDLGARKNHDFADRFTAYGEGFIGLGFVDKIDATLVAPGANFITQANDLYDQSVAFSIGANGGVVFKQNDHLGVFLQLGLRYVTGLAEVDNLVGTGLETLNDKSARWTVPFVAGVKYGF